MKNQTKKLASYTSMVACMAWILQGCGRAPEENASDACDNIGHDEESANPYISSDNYIATCKKGVEYGRMHMFLPFEKLDNAPDKETFRRAYNRAHDQCLTLHDHYEQMACLDGLDGYAALLAESGNYQTQDYSNQTIPASYYYRHTYVTVYNDYPTDWWMYNLMHRSFYPEYYPGYRRDQYYRMDYSATKNPRGDAWMYPEKNAPISRFTPAERNVGVTVNNSIDRYAPAGERLFGPKAPPRPYSNRSVWYSEEAPGQPGWNPNQKFTPGVGGEGGSYGRTNSSRFSAVRGGFGGTGSATFSGGNSSGSYFGG